MKTFINNTRDPQYNLAWEEYIFENIHIEEDIFLLWQNDNSIIIGKEQNVFQNTNIDYIFKNKLDLLRRNYSSKSIFNDLGSINYTYITNDKNDFDIVTGIKNSLNITDSSIISNDVFVSKNRYLYSGTILADTNLEHLNASIKSNNLKDNLNNFSNSIYIKELITTLFETFNLKQNVIFLSKKDLKQINLIKQEKYNSFRWNYSYPDNYIIEKELGDYKIKITVTYGMINDAIIIHEETLAVFLTASIVGMRLYPPDLKFLIKKTPEIYQMLFE